MDIKELEKQKTRLVMQRDKVLSEFDFEASNSFQDWEDAQAPFNDKIARLSYLIALQTPVEWDDIPDYGDLMTIEEWIECVESGGFIDYDGHGNYSNGEKVSDHIVHPSDVAAEQIIKRDDFTHVVWYNR